MRERKADEMMRFGEESDTEHAHDELLRPPTRRERERRHEKEREHDLEDEVRGMTRGPIGEGSERGDDPRIVRHAGQMLIEQMRQIDRDHREKKPFQAFARTTSVMKSRTADWS